MEDLQMKIRDDEHILESEKEQIVQMAQLMNNSTLLKSYESVLASYEQEFEKKNMVIKDMEREL